jgi:hypothetical protein
VGLLAHRLNTLCSQELSVHTLALCDSGSLRLGSARLLRLQVPQLHLHLGSAAGHLARFLA